MLNIINCGGKFIKSNPRRDRIRRKWSCHSSLGKAYGVIADVFIQIEKEIYDQMMWIGFKPFKITNIKQESEDIKSFTVETEEYDFSEFTPGQYITVDVSSDKLPYRAKRHYSIVSGEKTI